MAACCLILTLPLPSAQPSVFVVLNSAQDFVMNLRVEAVGVLEEGQTVTGAALTVHDYVETNLQIESLQGNLTVSPSPLHPALIFQPTSSARHAGALLTAT
jgi:hypothetical protein